MQKEALVLQLLRGERAARVPVWAMRQAGRTLASYRRLRAKVGDFRHMIRTPALATQVTLLPIEDLGADAAIIFSDILVIPEAMGFPYKMEEGRGPYFEQYLQCTEDVEQLRPVVAEESLGYVLETVRLTRRALPAHVPLIGFSGAPWTLLAYLLEGSGSKTYSRARSFLYQQPEAAHTALQRISAAVVNYLCAQVRSGADCLQLFDTLAEQLPPALYTEFGLPYLRQIATAVQAQGCGPLMVFAKGAGYALKALTELPCEALSIDWMTPMSIARQAANGKVLQGNFDPALLYAPRQRIATETQALLRKMEGHPYIANLGHGLYPDTPEDNVRFWMDCVKSYPNCP